MYIWQMETEENKVRKLNSDKVLKWMNGDINKTSRSLFNTDLVSKWLNVHLANGDRGK